MATAYPFGLDAARVVNYASLKKRAGSSADLGLKNQKKRKDENV
jgi:hypothetical protein